MMENVRWFAAEALGFIGPEAVSALIEALKNRDVFVRFRAANALAEIGPEAKAAVPALIEALKDQDQIVRINAEGTLRRIGLEAKKETVEAKVTDAVETDLADTDKPTKEST